MLTHFTMVQELPVVLPLAGAADVPGSDQISQVLFTLVQQPVKHKLSHSIKKHSS